MPLGMGSSQLDKTVPDRSKSAASLSGCTANATGNPDHEGVRGEKRTHKHTKLVSTPDGLSLLSWQSKAYSAVLAALCIP